MLDIPGIPRDRRGIVLLCGFIAAAAVGIAALLVQDPIGYGFLVVAAIGYYFHQTRLVPGLLWLLVAAYGAAGALAGDAVDWVECALGLFLAAVALAPPLATHDQVQGGKQAGAQSPISANGETSAFPEVSQARSSANAEVSPPNGEQALVRDQAQPEGQLVIRAIGPLSLIGPAGDLGPRLDDKPVLAFLFKYLLARWASGDPRVMRSALGDELSPGVTETSQRERLRKQLYSLQKDLPPSLGGLIRTNRTQVWLDLSSAGSDLEALRGLAEQVRQQGLIGPELAGEIQRALDSPDSQFLAGFEELENRVNQGRGTAGQVVSAARETIANQRAELVRSIAEYCDAMDRPEAAIPYLRVALDAQPERQDLARLLVVAYLKTGQSARASEVRRQFALKQE